MAAMEMPEPHRGALLVATHGLTDPNFSGTVVLLLEHGDEGTLGLVLNRPSRMDVATIVSEPVVEPAPPAVLFHGGPVEPDAVVTLGLGVTAAAARPVVGRVAVVAPGPAGAREGLETVRLFAGHAGWAAGQLVGEVATGAWYVVEAEPTDAFSPEPNRLWQDVLARRGALYRTVPPDPSLN